MPAKTSNEPRLLDQHSGSNPPPRPPSKIRSAERPPQRERGGASLRTGSAGDGSSDPVAGEVEKLSFVAAAEDKPNLCPSPDF